MSAGQGDGTAGLLRVWSGRLPSSFGPGIVDRARPRDEAGVSGRSACRRSWQLMDIGEPPNPASRDGRPQRDEHRTPTIRPRPRSGRHQPAAGTAIIRAVHTPIFPALLRGSGGSLLVTTYQAGKLVMVRDEGDHLNTHFRAFQAPMGLALQGDRLAIGTTAQVWEFVDVPAVTAKLEPAGRHDACFLPRSSHITGNVQIHEMAWGKGEELWFVNTRFSCLCTMDRTASFTPRWRPPFVTALEPTDRCHLNGLGMVEAARAM